MIYFYLYFIGLVLSVITASAYVYTQREDFDEDKMTLYFGACALWPITLLMIIGCGIGHLWETRK